MKHASLMVLTSKHKHLWPIFMGGSASYYRPVIVYFIVGNSLTWIVARIYNTVYYYYYYYYYIAGIKQIG
jgi:hypothetical protein